MMPLIACWCLRLHRDQKPHRRGQADLQELRDINEKLSICRVHTELTKAGKFDQLHDQVIIDERREGDRLAIVCVAVVCLDVNWLREELDKLVGGLSAWNNDFRVSYLRFA
jgi:hypothetical protein